VFSYTSKYCGRCSKAADGSASRPRSHRHVTYDDRQALTRKVPSLTLCGIADKTSSYLGYKPTGMISFTASATISSTAASPTTRGSSASQYELYPLAKAAPQRKLSTEDAVQPEIRHCHACLPAGAIVTCRGRSTSMSTTLVISMRRQEPRNPRLVRRHAVQRWPFLPLPPVTIRQSQKCQAADYDSTVL
jgi:hypothetical protein